jgi:hypothetical protein
MAEREAGHSMTTFVTIAANNYLPEAILLRRSLAKHHANDSVVLVQPERAAAVQLVAKQSFDELLTLEDLGYEEPEKFAFMHDITELSTAIKARALSRLMQYGKNVVYIDPDCLAYSRFSEVEALFDGGAQIVLTPHHLHDEATIEGMRDNVFRTLKCGIFNLGFIGIGQGAAAKEFISWWSNKLDLACYVDFERGLFVDQKWVDLAMSFFHLDILAHPGYNVANWNTSKRVIHLPRESPVVNGLPLRFFHFSGHRVGKDLRYLRKYDQLNGGAAEKLRKEYKLAVQAVRAELALDNEAWSYGRYSSGELIDDFVRKYVRQHSFLLDGVATPFALSNEEWQARF